jgi:hypothetical protein
VLWRARSFDSQISEPFVSFVIFVVKEIKVTTPDYPQESPKSQNKKAESREIAGEKSLWAIECASS